MNGSGPTVPRVDDQELYSVLCQGVSQDASLLDSSTKAMASMANDRFGTFDTLQRIAAQKDVPLPVRQLAILQFKNHALGHWRSRKLLSEELRQNIKQRILSFIDEEDDTLAGTNAFVAARIARSDVQSNWYSAFATELMGIISPGLHAWAAQQNLDVKAPTPLRRALQCLYAMIKELVTVKMPSGLKATGQLVVMLYQTLFELYALLVQEISTLTLSTLSSLRATDNIVLAHLVFKSLSNLSVWLFTQIGKKDKDFIVFDPALRQVCQSAAAQLPPLANLRGELTLQYHHSPTSDIGLRGIERFTRHVLVYGKMFRRLQQVDKTRFAALPGFTEVVLYYWSKVVQSTQVAADFIADSRHAVYPIRFLVQAMVLFQHSLSIWAPVNRQGVANAVVMPENDVKEAVRILVQQFIPLKVNDLQEWEENPEQWVNEEETDNDQWEFELRPCGERLLMTFANQYSHVVIPFLGATFAEVAAQKSSELPFILQKEALYCAIGRCAHKLKDEIDFRAWLESTLLPEAMETNPVYRIIKRRIAWLIGKWVSEQCASPQNPRVWEVLVHLLQEEGSGTDTVVHVTAAAALCDCVDTIEFDLQVFLPFLQAAVLRLVLLSSEVDDINTKRRITKTLNVVVEHAGQHIVPVMEPIAQSIPTLWSEASAEQDWLFKASLVEVTTKLIESASGHSRMLHPLVIPLLREILAPGAMTFLDEDALNLWLSTLRCSTPPLVSSPSIFELFPNAVALLHDNLDLLGKITSIIESYFLLDAPVILQRAQQSSQALFAAYKNSLSAAFSVNVKYLLISLQMLVQQAPSVLWAEAMHLSGLFASLLQTILDDKADTIVLSEHIHLFARMAVMDVQVFCQLMNSAIASNPMNVPNPAHAAWEGLMDQWWNKFDSMSEPRHRKLTAMAMANLVTSGNPIVLNRLPGDIFNLWLDVFGEVKEATTRSEERPDSPLNLYWEQDDAPEAIFGNTEGTPEYGRRKAMWDTDPVRTTPLTAFVAARLQQAEGAIPELHEIMARADPTVVAQIRAELMNK